MQLRYYRAQIAQAVLQAADIVIQSERRLTGPVTFRENTDSETLIAELGPDIVWLSLLADVPLHRPLMLSHENFTGHWRWLRHVWTYYKEPGPEQLPQTAEIPPNILTSLQQQKYHTAIAHLHLAFRALSAKPFDNMPPTRHLGFLTALQWFCPYIGAELLYRYGRIESSAKRSPD
ncbi:hypothetical protein [Thalassospira sp.]|uniref:hypothetical protein n=1 Tax=Thalassospira sp. TaxID=1912094 RepID=UPI0027348858|nr:hypothetical protein [Thalassospira sp.]MDP2699232.1 hypothetical protein [Thalassospira sp.]